MKKTPSAAPSSVSMLPPVSSASRETVAADAERNRSGAGSTTAGWWWETAVQACSCWLRFRPQQTRSGSDPFERYFEGTMPMAHGLHESSPTSVQPEVFFWVSS